MDVAANDRDRMGDNDTNKDKNIITVPIDDTSIDIWQELNDKNIGLYSYCIQRKGWTERYTPMQYSAKYGHRELTRKLLKANVHFPISHL